MGRVRQEGPHQAGVRRRHGRPGGWPQRHRDAPESHEDGQDASSGRYFNFNSFSLASTVGGIWLLKKNLQLYCKYRIYNLIALTNVTLLELSYLSH